MGGCKDFCVDADYDYYNEFFAASTRTAAKEHRCGECGGTIAVGSKYERACGKSEGYWFTAKTCLPCVEIRDALMCGQYLYENVWDEIKEHSFPAMLKTGPFECLAELKSVEARNLLSQRFAEWSEHDQ